MHIDLYTATKNTDLIAMSAQTAVQDLLDINAVQTLQRFHHWRLFLNTNDSASIDALKAGVSDCYFLINPNKEHLYIDSLPDAKRSNAAHYRLEVSDRAENGHPSLLGQCERHGLSMISRIESSTVWDIYTDPEFTESELVRQVVQTESMHQGLLVNPITQTWKLLQHVSH